MLKTGNVFVSAAIKGLHGRGWGAVLLAGLAAVAVGFPAQAAPAPAEIPFLAHQAVYDLALLKSRRTPAIDSVKGRIVYDFSGNACEGYTTEFRQVSNINVGEGRDTMSDLRSTSWEQGDGKAYRFHIESRANETLTSVVEGEATRTATHVVVTLRQPANKTIKLDAATIFPTEQIRRIMAAARAGQSVLELSVYDGSDNGEKVYHTLAVIGQPLTGGEGRGAADAALGDPALRQLTRWPVTVSYYDRAAPVAQGEQTPVYAMSFELYENGVSRALTIDYNDFVVGGPMAKYESHTTKPCR